MADRKFELDEALVRPGTYFNPQTEVTVVVDDSASVDREIFNLEEFEGADWVLIADDLPVDEPMRDELMEKFQVRYHPGTAQSISDEGDYDDTVDDAADHQDVGREDLAREEAEEED